MTARPAHHARHRHRDNHSLHLARQIARHSPPAACLLPVASRHDLRVYASGYADEEDLCVEERGVAVGGETGFCHEEHREVFAFTTLVVIYMKFISYI